MGFRPLNSMLERSETQSLHFVVWKSSLRSADFPSKILEFLSFQMAHMITAGIMLHASLQLGVSLERDHDSNDSAQEFYPTPRVRLVDLQS